MEEEYFSFSREKKKEKSPTESPLYEDKFVKYIFACKRKKQNPSNHQPDTETPRRVVCAPSLRDSAPISQRESNTTQQNLRSHLKILQLAGLPTGAAAPERPDRRLAAGGGRVVGAAAGRGGRFSDEASTTPSSVRRSCSP